jgi:D-alanyl-D-alanine carboxypeptidase
MGILARAIIRDLPEYEYFVHIPAIKFGRRITGNFNKLIGRYPGADGMKTGFICASGFNLVASATRGNKRLIAVVLGAQSSAQRAIKAAQLLEKGFHGNRLAWLRPSLGNVDMLAPIDASPPNLREERCGPRRKRPAADEDDDVEITMDGDSNGTNSPFAFAAAGLQAPNMKASDLLAAAPTPAAPVIVYTGPARTGADILAADAAETERQAANVKNRKKGAKPKVAAKPDAAKPGTAKPDAKPAASAAAKPTAKPAAKPVADAKPATKPAAHAASAAAKHTAKPAAKPAANAAPAKPKANAKSGAAAKPAADSKSASTPRS